MSYNFNTIDGLFRPNYEVYKPFFKVQKSEPINTEPLQFIYKPENIQRIKTIVPEWVEYVDAPSNVESSNITKDKNEPQTKAKYLQKDQDYFMSELNKFITANPEYANIKNDLQYLAELESSYKLSEENHQGSGALGWFQFMDSTRASYNQQTREQFAKDPQAQLLAAAQYYTQLQNSIKRRGGNPSDFVTMYGAWWRPNSAYAYIKNPKYDFTTEYNESFQKILQKARNLLSRYGKSNS